MCVGAFISQLVWAQARFCVHVEVQIGGVEEAGGQGGRRQSQSLHSGHFRNPLLLFMAASYLRCCLYWLPAREGHNSPDDILTY